MSTAKQTSRTAAVDLPRHTIPVINRMMDVLGVLERHGDGVSITEITQHLGLPRTTIYRMLNTLHAHDMVHRDGDGVYRLGRRIRTLAARVTAAAVDVDLASLAQPHLDRMAGALGASVKLSVIDQHGVLVVAVAQGRQAYALAVAPGQRMPPHAGAAGKLLLAHLPAEQQAQWLARSLDTLTAKTITDPARLNAELARIRRHGWSQDRGESAPGIHAYAAPVRGPAGTVVAALSLPFLFGTEPHRMEELRAAVVGTASAISEAIGG